MNSTPPEPSYRSNSSPLLRIWHWSNLLVIMGSLTTVLLAKTILKTKNNVALVQSNLQANQVTVTSDQAKSVAHDFNDLAWNWHVFLGYTLSALLLLRILYELFRPKQQRLISLLKKTLKYIKIPATEKGRAKHYLFVKSTYLSFYLTLFLQACTGLFMAYSDGKDDLKPLRHNASDIHSVLMWVILGFIAIHIAGVIRAEFTHENKGIVSDMINGGENKCKPPSNRS